MSGGDYALHRVLDAGGTTHWARSNNWATLCEFKPALSPRGWRPGKSVDCGDCLSAVQRLDPLPFSVGGPVVNLLALNEHGVPVSTHTCQYCGGQFTVTPAVATEKWGMGCLADKCPSYDIDRDATYLFGPDIPEEQ